MLNYHQDKDLTILIHYLTLSCFVWFLIYSVYFTVQLRVWENMTLVGNKSPGDWLMKQEAYTLHKPIRRNLKRNWVFVCGIDLQWQLDFTVTSYRVKLPRVIDFNGDWEVVLYSIAYTRTWCKCSQRLLWQWTSGLALTMIVDHRFYEIMLDLKKIG